jgi:cardiolipin synthase (CMP-forming)
MMTSHASRIELWLAFPYDAAAGKTTMTTRHWTPRLTLANRITIARFLFIPVFILLTIYYMDSVAARAANEVLRWSATLVFVITCLTDALDGYIARSRNQRTRLGTILDPLADKFLLLSGLVLLTGPWGRVFEPHIPVWYVVLVMSRDVLLIAGSSVIHLMVSHIDVRPRLAGKLATVFQMLLILWVLIGGAAQWFLWLLGLAAACTLTSAVQYIVDGIRQLEKAHVHERDPTTAA